VDNRTAEKVVAVAQRVEVNLRAAPNPWVAHSKITLRPPRDPSIP